MQITRILLEDVRAIRRMELDLSLAPGVPRNRTIILGVNGAGKTTILDAVVHAFATLAQVPRLGGAVFGGSDVRNDDEPEIKAQRGLGRGSITIGFALTESDQRVVRGRNLPVVADGEIQLLIEKEIDWELAALNYGLDWPRLPSLQQRFLSGNVLETDETFEAMAKVVISDGDTHPICVLLPSDRGLLEVPPNLTLDDVMGFDSCNLSLSRSRQRFAPIAARLALCGNPPRNDDERSVTRMWKVIEKYFPEMPRPIEPKGSMLRFRDRRGAIVPLTSLSDGERAILLIFADLALRNPQNNVVLIDEIEQHLHPRWQRQMLYGLSSLLPNAQFIITTQSPYLAACAPDDVIKLPDWDSHGE